jgi:hypothetical protein
MHTRPKQEKHNTIDHQHNQRLARQHAQGPSSTFYGWSTPLALSCLPAKISPCDMYGCKQAGGVVLFQSEYRLLW